MGVARVRHDLVTKPPPEGEINFEINMETEKNSQELSENKWVTGERGRNGIKSKQLIKVITSNNKWTQRRLFPIHGL